MNAIRLSCNILNDPKIGMLPDNLWRRTIELYLVSAHHNKGGELPPLDYLAWHLHRTQEVLKEELAHLLDRGILYESTDGSLMVRDFIRIKLTQSSAERVRRYRERRTQNGMSISPGYDEEALKRRDQHKCVYCSSEEDLCIDHIYPILFGGTDDYSNLATACKECNSGKGGRTPEQAGMKFQNKAAEDRYKDYLAMWDTTNEIAK